MAFWPWRFASILLCWACVAGAIHVSKTSELVEAVAQQTVNTSSYFQELSARVRSTHMAAHGYHTSADDDCMPQSMRRHLRTGSTGDVEKRLRENKPVSFIRIGDGDVFCVSGAAGSNLEGISYGDHQAQCQDLATSLQQLGSQDSFAQAAHGLAGVLCVCPAWFRLWGCFM